MDERKGMEQAATHLMGHEDSQWSDIGEKAHLGAVQYAIKGT